MKSYDFEAIAYGGECYCVDCLPNGVSVNDEDVYPIFADSEWDDYPVCAVCGTVHDYVGLIPKDKEKQITAHTPGPWHYRHRFHPGDREHDQIDAYAITAQRGEITIAETLYSCADDEANAHLIAAAPELLAACQLARDYFQDPIGFKKTAALMDELLGAIRKATGKKC